MFVGEIITSPALLSSGDASTAEAEHSVPMTPTTCRSAITCSALARPPSGEHIGSIDSPSSTS